MCPLLGLILTLLKVQLTYIDPRMEVSNLDLIEVEAHDEGKRGTICNLYLEFLQGLVWLNISSPSLLNGWWQFEPWHLHLFLALH